MKNIVVFLLLTAFTSGLYSQNNNCSTPITNQQFQQKFEQIKNKPNDKSRLITAKQIVKNYCFSSSQIKELASLFENDFERFEFAKAAYDNTSDKDNFYDVYDAFIYYSVVFRLHDFVLTKRNTSSTENDDEVNNEIDIVFPHYNYPNFKAYRGEKKCSEVISKEIFNFIVKKVNSYEDDNQKYLNAFSLIKNKCIPTEYLMKIGSLISSEKSKLDFSKEAINSVYDIDQYIEMRQIFNTPKGRSDFMNILSGNSVTNSNDCQINQQEYNKIISSIKNEQYNSTKVNSAKHIIQTKSCFTALQIKGIIELFGYENSKLEIAILAYDFVTDPSNYYMVVSKSLSFESSRKKLLDHINKKER